MKTPQHDHSIDIASGFTGVGLYSEIAGSFQQVVGSKRICYEHCGSDKVAVALFKLDDQRLGSKKEIDHLELN